MITSLSCDNIYKLNSLAFSPSPLEGEGWVGGTKVYCICINIIFLAIVELIYIDISIFVNTNLFQDSRLPVMNEPMKMRKISPVGGTILILLTANFQKMTFSTATTSAKAHLPLCSAAE
jgi:hypothetical protein